MINSRNKETFGNYIVYLDETGDHNLDKTDPEYPIFGLVPFIAQKDEYANRIVPAIQEFKFKWFGHDMVILHENEIRGQEGIFKFLSEKRLRDEFMEDLCQMFKCLDFVTAPIVVKKQGLLEPIKKRELREGRFYLYHFCFKYILDYLLQYLPSTETGITFIVCESRGKKEDKELEEEFEKFCQENEGYKIFRLKIAKKEVNSTGLQLADLIARPIALNVYRPEQHNRAYEIIKEKIFRRRRVEYKGKD